MNLTPLEHVAEALGIAAVVMVLTYLLVDLNVLAGCTAGVSFFIGRELCQAEYRWISTYGAGLRANLPWWGCFDPRVWRSLDSTLDWVAPTVALAAVYLWSLYG